jgi:hypothetical protein
MITIEELKKIDLKNIDVVKLKALFLEKKDSLAQAAVILLTIFLLISFIKGYFKSTAEVNAEIKQLNEKVEYLSSLESSKKQIGKYLNAVPKSIDEDELSSQIADFASQNKITILSFSPGQKTEDEKSVTMKGRFDTQASSYKDFLSFLKALEDAPFALRVDSCSVTQIAGNISSGIEYSSVSIKK